jgi:hypothetical protein
MRKHIHTEIDIAAPTEVVWATLADLAAYPEWNPYHVKVDGDLSVGSRLVVHLHKPNGDDLTIKPHVMRITPGRELTWGGGIRGVFFGEHQFLLEPVGTATHLVHRETFSGLAVRYARLDAIEEGYEGMNQALEERVEAWMTRRVAPPRGETPWT